MSEVPQHNQLSYADPQEGLVFRVPGLYLSFYSCGLSTATIEYSSACVCVCVCVSVSTITQKKSSRNLKFEYIVAYENISDEFDIGHCLTKIKVRA